MRRGGEEEPLDVQDPPFGPAEGIIYSSKKTCIPLK